MLTVYELPTCSTCRKAKRLLKDKNISVNYINLKETPPSVEEFKKILETFDIPLKKLFNTNGQLYKEMNLKDKLQTLSVDEALLLLSENGMLVKRPLVIDFDNDILLLGFKEEEWLKAIL